MRWFQYVVLVFLGLAVACSSRKTAEHDCGDDHFSVGDSLQLGLATELLYYKNEYHLFYQCENADGMACWGHSKSADLLKWKQFPQLINAGPLQHMGAGSVVVDYNNTSGLGEGHSPLVGIYADNQSGKGQKVSVVYSTDEGKSWNDYSKNPLVINHGFYPVVDPKVVWHEESQRWVMLIVAGYQVQFYGSEDLLNWIYLGEFGDVYEEMGEWSHIEFLPVNVEESGERKWVLFIAGDQGAPNARKGTRYFVGDFDGYTFMPFKKKGLWLDGGTDTYAGVGAYVYDSHAETTAFIGCMTDGETAYTSPRNIVLKKRYNNYYLAAKSLLVPPKNSKTILMDSREIFEKEDFDGHFRLPVMLDLNYEVNNRKYLDFAEAYGIILTNEKGDELTVGYHNMKRYFFISIGGNNRQESSGDKLYFSPYIIDGSKMDVKLIITKSSVELYVEDGFLCMTQQFPISYKFNRIQFFSEGGKIKLMNGKLTEL